MRGALSLQSGSLPLTLLLVEAHLSFRLRSSLFTEAQPLLEVISHPLLRAPEAGELVLLLHLERVDLFPKPCLHTLRLLLCGLLSAHPAILLDLQLGQLGRCLCQLRFLVFMHIFDVQQASLQGFGTLQELLGCLLAGLEFFSRQMKLFSSLVQIFLRLQGLPSVFAFALGTSCEFRLQPLLLIQGQGSPFGEGLLIDVSSLLLNVKFVSKSFDLSFQSISFAHLLQQVSSHLLQLLLCSHSLSSQDLSPFTLL
mmetsp:Transcript_72726/g.115436  ORF Transcript_72726/g.115436 Transcript_72726/m.115436 type:complete len:254 (-) Transcript_72726:729-1490(-)